MAASSLLLLAAVTMAAAPPPARNSTNALLPDKSLLPVKSRIDAGRKTAKTDTSHDLTDKLKKAMDKLATDEELYHKGPLELKKLINVVDDAKANAAKLAKTGTPVTPYDHSSFLTKRKRSGISKPNSSKPNSSEPKPFDPVEFLMTAPCSIAKTLENASDPLWDSLRDGITALFWGGLVLTGSPELPYLLSAAKYGAQIPDENLQYTFGYYCDPARGGQTIVTDEVSGKEYKVDAFYCGNPELSWDAKADSLLGPVADLCNAPEGMSAYTENGICGSRTSKDLVLGVCDYQPGWMDDPYTINVPGMDCALGIVDFDIYYCKGCAGLCSTESGSGPEPDGGTWA